MVGNHRTKVGQTLDKLGTIFGQTWGNIWIKSCPKKGQTSPPGGPKIDPRRAKSTPRGQKSGTKLKHMVFFSKKSVLEPALRQLFLFLGVQSESQERPRASQERQVGPKRRPRGSKLSPRGAQERPSWAQEAPKRPQVTVQERFASKKRPPSKKCVFRKEN